MSSTVAIHQPNFFPWLGYFDKILQSDIFVFLDSVQISKKSTWGNRVQLLVGGSPRWATASLDRTTHGFIRIDEARFHDSEPWRSKLTKSIEINYRRHPAYAEVSPVIFELIANKQQCLSEYNIAAITALAQHLDLPESRFVRSTELEDLTGSSNELLVSIVRSVGGSAYLTGAGALDYLDEETFRNAGIEVCHQQFRHPVYTQHGAKDFTSGLSSIDALMNLGWTGVRELLWTTRNV